MKLRQQLGRRGHLDLKLPYQLQQKRHIWPLIAAGAAGVALHYAYRALNRMERDKGKESEQPADATNPHSSTFGNSAIGIDIGSAYSRLALASIGGSVPLVVENREGLRSTRSSVHSRQGLDRLFDQSLGANLESSYGDDILVGSQAHKVRFLKPNVTIVGEDLINNRQSREESTAKAKGQLSAAERAVIYSILAKELRAVADTRPEIAASAPAVVTTPNNFTSTDSSLVLSACNAAGFHCVATVPDAVASVLACTATGMLQLSPSVESNNDDIAVVDIGGSIVQLSIVRAAVFGSKDASSSSASASTILNSGIPIILREKTLFGCGGNAFDVAIAQYLASTFSKSHGSIDIMADPTAKSRMFDAAESAKIELSNSATTTINIPFLTADHTGPKHLNSDISRAKLEEILSKQIESIEQSLQEMINSHAQSSQSLSKSQSHSSIRAVLLVGGGARTLLLKTRLQKLLNSTPLIVPPQPEEANAIGAAVMWKLLTR